MEPAFLQRFLHQSKTILAIWFLGLTVMAFLDSGGGILAGHFPGIHLKFLFKKKAGAGIILSFIAVLPQNIVYIPFLLIWAVVAVNASLYILKGRNNSYLPLGTALIAYSLLMLLFILVFLLGAFIEAYLSPWLLQLLV